MRNHFVTLDRAACDLCVHIGTMRRWVREGRIPAKKIGSGQLLVEPLDSILNLSELSLLVLQLMSRAAILRMTSISFERKTKWSALEIRTTRAADTPA